MSGLQIVNAIYKTAVAVLIQLVAIVIGFEYFIKIPVADADRYLSPSADI